MTAFQDELAQSRIAGTIAATQLLEVISQEGAESFWREHANADTSHAYGYWTGFLNVLVERK